MSKLGKKLIAAAREFDAHNVDYAVWLSETGVEDSCGCVFCDLGLDPIDGEHIVRGGHTEPCGLLKAPE